MSSSNPFGFLGGMFLELGAVVAVLAVLWQPSKEEGRPAIAPDVFASQPVRFLATPAAPSYAAPATRTSLISEQRSDVFAYRPLPAERPFVREYQARDHERLLPPAPPAWEQSPPAWERGRHHMSPEPWQELRQESRVATAQPYVRSIASERPALVQQPQHDYAPASYRAADRTADRNQDGRHGDFYNRY